MIENQNASPEQDALRTELLDLLRRELRPDTARLALLLGTPESEVKAELERLEAEGIILGYGATVDETRLNGETVTGLIELRVQPQRDRGFDRIAQRIYRFPQVQSCYLMSGDYDLLITVEGRTLREVAEFVSERIASSESVLSTRTHFILKTYKESGRILFDSDEDQREVMVL
ncbi:MAG: Lrp/AsnC family transcriptional regulator [Bacillota bacterium]|nr:Lrp/AsnC family transcriptional regulator [Bacillota bacterium]